MKPGEFENADIGCVLLRTENILETEVFKNDYVRLDNHVLNPQGCSQAFLPPVIAAFSNFSGVMHQSIPVVPIPPPGNRGAFAYVVSPGGWALAYPGRPPGI